jgi:hypothetical protein
MAQKLIYDIFPEIVAKAAEICGKPLRFQTGTLEEINADLATPSDDALPLVWLITEKIPFKRGIKPVSIDVEARISFVIAQFTLKEYTTAQRIEYNFIPDLYPILRAIEKAVLDCTDIHFGNGVESLECDQSDLFCWGRADSKVFIKNVDVILVENLNLKIKKQTCYGKS